MHTHTSPQISVEWVARWSSPISAISIVQWHILHVIEQVCDWPAVWCILCYMSPRALRDTAAACPIVLLLSILQER
jgi:hypothetical protein